MNNKESEYFKSRIAAIINSLKDIKDITEEIGSFIESELEEEFNENIDCAIMALSDCLENLHSDEVMEEMDERKNKDIEDQE